jgi:MEDS: MEthanogen/methylotroph, DcmR Sensory domain
MEFVQDAAARDHGVQVYSHVDELATSVAAYLAAGFERGQPAVVIATAEHREAFARELAARGWSDAKLDTYRLALYADAEKTLDAILVDGRPSEARFEDVAGSVLDRAAELFPGRRPRAFGEMVDVLCARGQLDAAAELEEIWNRFGRTRRFSLLCGYHLDVFDLEAQTSVLPAVCSAHTHVLPAADPARLDAAVDAALEETFGDGAKKVRAVLGERAQAEHVPRAELALMWISEQAPKLAERVLASAQAHYLRTSTTS